MSYSVFQDACIPLRMEFIPIMNSEGKNIDDSVEAERRARGIVLLLKILGKNSICGFFSGFKPPKLD